MINERLAEHFILLFATSLMNSIGQEHECLIRSIVWHKDYINFEISFLSLKRYNYVIMYATITSGLSILIALHYFTLRRDVIIMINCIKQLTY